MKARILSFAIALIALFAFSDVQAQNPKWTKGPCYSGNTIEGMATGLGSGPYYLRVTGQYDCVNKGGQTPQSHNWSDLDIIVPVQNKRTGGNFKLTATLNICPKPKWDTYLQNVVVTLYDNPSATGTPVLGPTSASPCQ
jgi:hypothetical protein